MRTTTLERPALLKALAAHPFLEGVDERLLMLLLAGAESFRFRNGERLAKMGRPANDFFLIQTGQVAVLAAGDDGREVCRIGAGEVLGWSWMVPPYRWQFDCKAVGQATGIRFNADWLRKRCEEHHELGYVIMKHLLVVLAGRLAATRYDQESPTVEVLC